MLYDKATNDIWVDANQDRDFTNDGGPMRPYAENFQVGHFGTDNPATEVREQMPFTVEFREDVDVTPLGLPGVEDFVNIGIIEDEHGSHVAGITSANDMFGNPNLDGAAPGAKLVAARACNWGGGCTAAALTDGMVELVTNRGVDVVNMSIGGLPALNDGNNARAELYNRLIDDYGVQIVLSAGNSGPGLNTVGDPAVVDNAISAAASISKETWLANYGSVTRVPYQLFNFSSRGPAEDGGNKPTVSAPGSAISTTPLWQPGVPVPEAGYALPPGYQMINGTSMAAPQTAGGVALLLSAAKATDKGLTPAAIRRAISSSADWIKGASAAGQGNGLLDIPGAWALLKGKPLETRGYTVDAPVCTAISDFLATPDRGIGIYNRCAVGEGGLRAGQTRTYAVRITRTSGPAGTVRHNLSWLGNDGTFSSSRRVDLPLNRAVRVDVTVKATDGAHSAILRVDDPKTPAVDHELLNTIVVSNAPRRPGFSYSTSGAVDRNNYKSFFVTVPEGAAALQVNLSGIATGSQTRFIAFNPWGVPVDNTNSPFCYTNFSDPATCKPQERSYENPLPGVWEIEVESRRTSPALVNPFNLTARIQGVTVEPATVELPSVEAGVPSPVTWTVTNNFGPVTVSGEGGPLGSAFVQRPTIADGEQQTLRGRGAGGRVQSGRGHRQHQRPRGRPRPVRLQRRRHPRGAGRRRRLGGVGVDPEPGGGHVHRRRRRVRGAGGDHRVRLPGRVLLAGARRGGDLRCAGDPRERRVGHDHRFRDGAVRPGRGSPAVRRDAGRDGRGRGRRPRQRPDRHGHRRLSAVVKGPAPFAERALVTRRRAAPSGGGAARGRRAPASATSRPADRRWCRAARSRRSGPAWRRPGSGPRP